MSSSKRSFRLTGRPRDVARDVQDEIRFHLEMRAQEFMERGMTPDDARRAAAAAFGDVPAIEAECRDVRAHRARERARRDYAGGVLQDLRFAVRTLRKSPGFTVVAVLTLALGMGAATAVFAVADGVLLRPLPYHDPARIAMVWMTGPSAWRDAGQLPLSAGYYLDVRAQTRAFTQLAAFRSWAYNLSDVAEPELVAGSRTTPELFEVLGARPLVGRTFTAAEAVFGGPRVALISHALWRRKFGSAPDVVGRQITLGGERYTVLGVMPEGFAFPRGAELPSGLQVRPRTDVWTPLTFSPEDMRNRGTLNLAVVGRLRPGVSLGAARSDLAAIAARLRRAVPPRINEELGLTTLALKEQAAAPVRPGLLMLLGGVACVLLIACSNVANLLVARTAARRRELTVRAALGAGRGRLARQLVTENVLLALAGAALGVLLAVWGKNAMLALVPGDLPRADDVVVDGRVLLAALVAAVTAGAVFGVAAAAAGVRGDLARGLSGSRGAIGAQGRAGRRLLVGGEVALTLMLLIGAGLLARSFLRLQRVAPGFDPHGALTAGVLMPIGNRFDQEREGPAWSAFFNGYVERLRALPGVRAAGAVSSLPLTGAVESTGYSVEGEPPQRSREQSAEYAVITSGYFRAMAIPMVAGRDFDARDRREAPGVVIVSRAFARRHWPRESAIGKRIKLGFGPDGSEIVGVVGDVKQTSLAATAVPAIYLPAAQFPYPFMSVVVRTAGEPGALAPALRREIAALDPAVAMHDVRTLDAVFTKSLAQQRFGLVLLGFFALTATGLAVVGVYGVIAHAVAQRTQEIGVRMALGARPRDAFRLVLGEGLRLTAAGLAAGLLGAYALSRFLSGLLYGVSATDAATFAAVTALLGAVALLASYVPARRATRVEPMVALRGE